MVHLLPDLLRLLVYIVLKSIGDMTYRFRKLLGWGGVGEDGVAQIGKCLLPLYMTFS